jgi:hypothetical protein
MKEPFLKVAGEDPVWRAKSENDDAVAFDMIENLVRKTARHQTAEAVVVNRRSGCSSNMRHKWYARRDSNAGPSA